MPNATKLASAQASNHRQQQQKKHHPQCNLKRAICLALTLGPSTFSSLAGPSSNTERGISPISVVCEAAPALWTPFVDALDKSGSDGGAGFLGSIFKKNNNKSTPSSSSSSSTTTTTGTSSGTSSPEAQGNSDEAVQKVEPVVFSNEVVATAEDFGVVRLDLEGDPNCDYTTKVKIAGVEYNVIIDTGSAHFAVASNACRDCVIPHKERWRPNEEEEIPIDGSDNNRSIVNTNGEEDDVLMRLMKAHQSIVHATATSSFSPTAAITTTSSLATPGSLAIAQGRMSGLPPAPQQQQDKVTATNATTTTTKAATVIANSSMANPHQSQGVLHLTMAKNSNSNNTFNATSFSSLSSAAATTTTLAKVPAATSTMEYLFNKIKPALDQLASAVPVQSSPRTDCYTCTGEGTREGTRERGGGKHLAAAPAGNLYTLSEDSRQTGKPIRVSYGIKTHSVGWSGVMTSDLMTLEMAKVDINSSSSTSSSSISSLSTTSTTLLEPGGIMEKETNVEFAAITENDTFFSPECGAQHGIWGLGYRSLSVDQQPTLFDTLSSKMKIPNGFALQLCGRTNNSTKSGNMFLGGYSSQHVANGETMQYVPLIKRDWYQVQLDGFKVMNQQVMGMQNLNAPKTIVDSGTTNIMMSHYNLQLLIQALARSEVIRWSSLVPEEDISNFWYRNAVLRLPRNMFEVDTRSRAVEVVISGVAIPIYTSSFLRIKQVLPAGQAPAGYVDLWWHGFASSTAPDQIEAERASGGAVMPGSVGTILGETLFAGKVVYFERGNEDAQPGDADFGRIGFVRGQNCFGPSDHSTVNVLASQGQIASVHDNNGGGGGGPVRVAATSHANKNGNKSERDPTIRASTAGKQLHPVHMPDVHSLGIGLKGPIRLMGSAATHPFMGDSSLLQKIVGGIVVAMVAWMI
ncbi:Beta-secretase 2 [Podila humilis]|nr:Beta-secretase 2 [Podila humilis]